MKYIVKSGLFLRPGLFLGLGALLALCAVNSSQAATVSKPEKACQEALKTGTPAALERFLRLYPVERTQCNATDVVLLPTTDLGSSSTKLTVPAVPVTPVVTPVVTPPPPPPSKPEGCNHVAEHGEHEHHSEHGEHEHHSEHGGHNS